MFYRNSVDTLGRYHEHFSLLRRPAMIPYCSAKHGKTEKGIIRAEQFFRVTTWNTVFTEIEHNIRKCAFART